MQSTDERWDATTRRVAKKDPIEGSLEVSRKEDDKVPRTEGRLRESEIVNLPVGSFGCEP